MSSSILTSTITRKVFTAASGLFLCVFLVGHLLGNLQLIFAGAEEFNAYALFMTTNPLVKVMSYITYFSILGHAFLGIYLAIQNKKARGVNYKKDNSAASWASKNMAILGSLILIFIIIHLKGFWYEMHFGDMPQYTLADGTVVKDLYAIVIAAFKELWYVILYVISMVVLAIHLLHGVKSSMQTLGMNHSKYNDFIAMKSKAFAIIVPALFAIIPVFIYFFK